MKSKFRFTIAYRLSLGFGILFLVIVYSSYLTNRTLLENLKDNRKIKEVHIPSVSMLHQFQTLLSDSKLLIKNWVYVEHQQDTPDKQKLKRLHSEVYPQLIKSFQPIVSQWNKEDKKIFLSVQQSVDSLFVMHQEIMKQLASFTDYDNDMLVFTITPRVEQSGDVMEITDRTEKLLNNLTKKHESIVNDSNKKIEVSFAQFERMVNISGVLLAIALLVVALSTIRSLTFPIQYIKRILLEMSRGVLPNEKIKSRNDEIGEMADALNQLIEGLQKTSDFSLEIGKGNLDCGFTPLSSDDRLGNSLLVMRESLKKADVEDEKRKMEDQQRNWTSQGFAMFGDILRENTENLFEYSYLIIKNLVYYLKINQGALFLINDNEGEKIYIDLMAAIAYERRKTEKQKIELGEGLVGRCLQEGETIYMTEIPQDYIKITSGLGEAQPTDLLLVPLKNNKTILGVIELASFSTIPQYQIEFVEKIGEVIASSVLNMKININTTRLLYESQEKSRKLATQEEETRQTMELMQARQSQLIEKINQQENNYQQTVHEYEDKISKLQIDLKLEREALLKEIEFLKKRI